MYRFLCGLLVWALFLPGGGEAAEAKAALSLRASQREFLDLAYVAAGSPSQRLDLYLPADSSLKMPLLVYIHSGGWEAGSKDECPARPLLNFGYAVASVEYRFSQVATFPAQLEDCKAAIRWLRAHAADFGYDPARIGVMGASAGGHLCALLGTTGHLRDFDVGENLEQSSRVQCVVDWFGPADFVNWGERYSAEVDRPSTAVSRLLGSTVRSDPARALRASPVNYIRSDAPPFLILHGDQDDLVPLQQSLRLRDLLEQAGVPCTFKIVSGAGHGGAQFMAPSNLLLMGQFLHRNLKKE